MVDFILVKMVAGFDRLAGLDWLLVIGIIGFRRRSIRLSVKDGRESWVVNSSYLCAVT